MSTGYHETLLGITPSQRFSTGIIVTLSRGDERKTIHETGLVRDALRRIADVCDAGGWKIQSISRPQTIYRDLLGHREARPGMRHGRPGRLGAAEEPPAGAYPPELHDLGSIGRRDLFAGRGPR